MMKELSNIIVQFLIEKFDPYLIILYGSAAKEEMHAKSDIDIAFLSEDTYSSYSTFMTAQELADLAGFEIDLLDLSKASTVMQVQVIGNGKVLYNKDRNKSSAFMMKALKAYTMLNEERKCIIDRIKERRSVYAK
jgi:uncharacterized protein